MAVIGPRQAYAIQHKGAHENKKVDAEAHVIEQDLASPGQELPRSWLLVRGFLTPFDADRIERARVPQTMEEFLLKIHPEASVRRAQNYVSQAEHRQPTCAQFRVNQANHCKDCRKYGTNAGE
eukprot:CAMPEP_0172666900 /NCGR_PEP_ID=MMETSP1074-20121228/8094_1 /TAXON_ID=2916 /ORGANISM="Ceratium fusus, Strain PA161109" /LENGTH=122 /DNA_ID=CAMNT_0013483341 /DNA_START=456 /DNA_END=824 /DNA_ORIENTATION=+